MNGNAIQRRRKLQPSIGEAKQFVEPVRTQCAQIYPVRRLDKPLQCQAGSIAKVIPPCRSLGLKSLQSETAECSGFSPPNVVACAVNYPSFTCESQGLPLS